MSKPKYQVTTGGGDNLETEDADNAFHASAMVDDYRRQGYRGVGVLRDGHKIPATRLAILALNEMPPPPHP